MPKLAAYNNEFGSSYGNLWSYLRKMLWNAKTNSPRSLVLLGAWCFMVWYAVLGFSHDHSITGLQRVTYCHGFWRSISILNFLLSWCGQGTKEIKPESEVSQPSCSLHQLAQVSKEHLDEFLSIHSWPPPRPPQPWVYWKPPSNDLVKINFNGAIFSEVKRSSIGVVVRDKNGLVLASLS